MQSSKRKKKKNNTKRFHLLKTLLLIFNALSIYLSITFKNYFVNPIYKTSYENLKENHFFRKENENCDKFDPIFLMAERFKRDPFTICKNKESNHICYLNSKFNKNNKIYEYTNGIICLSQNIILDPMKSQQTNYVYNGPIDKYNKGFPILSKGFFNMKCKNHRNFRGFNKIYKNYLDSWDYEYKKKKCLIVDLFIV